MARACRRREGAAAWAGACGLAARTQWRRHPVRGMPSQTLWLPTPFVGRGLNQAKSWESCCSCNTRTESRWAMPMTFRQLQDDTRPFHCVFPKQLSVSAGV